MGYLGTGKHSGGLHRPGTLIQEPHTNRHYRTASSDTSRTCLSHTLTVTHKHSHKDSLFIPLKREWPRLSSNKGAGFTSGIRGGESALVDLRTVYLHWKPRRCETPTLRRCTNIEAICRGGFNSLQSNDWLFPLPSLQELRQWIP